MSFIASKKLQDERAKAFNKRYVPIILKLLPKGIPTAYSFETDQPEVRSWGWNAEVLFAEGYYKEANHIIRNSPYHHCEFMPMQLTQMLVKYGDKFDDDTRIIAENYIKGALEYAANPRVHPTMYNDNFGNMATFTLIVAGELFNLPKYVEIGKDKLDQACDLFRRCGTIMEFGSPVYTPLDLFAFAQMANYIKDPEYRAKALQCEERMWVEVVTHYHAPTGHLAGPYSRAYGCESLGHPTSISALWYKVFGDKAFLNVMNYGFETIEKQVIHISANGLQLPNAAWFMNTTFHFPRWMEKVAMEKVFPYHAEFAVECISADALAYNEENEPLCAFGGHRSTNTTYMTPEYSLGTASHQYHSGAMSESFYVTYKNCEIANKLEDVGVMYSKYIFNDKQPNQENVYAYYGKCGKEGFRDEGRKFGIQHENTSMMLYRPLQLERKHVKSAKLTVFIPAFFYDGFEILAGGKPVKTLPYASVEPVTVCVKAYKSMFAFKPLMLSDFGREAAVKIIKKNDHIQISFYNYEGEEREFGDVELIHAQNGFVCTAATTEEYPDFAAFAKFADKGKISDVMEQSAKMYTRRVKYQNDGTELYFIYNPLVEGIVTATANKKPIGRHILKADMLDYKKIPLLED